MVATGFVKTLSADYPSISFHPAKDFRWIPEMSTIEYDPAGDPAYLLHELGHALLHHTAYTHDIELLAIERAAWTHAVDALADQYDITVDPHVIEDSLDTYREWMHKRSSCPSCNLNGIQAGPRQYRCVSCLATWTVNEARGCSLRRYKI